MITAQRPNDGSIPIPQSPFLVLLAATSVLSLMIVIGIDAIRFGHMTWPPIDTWAYAAPFVVHRLLSGASPQSLSRVTVVAVLGAALVSRPWNAPWDGSAFIFTDLPMAAGLAAIAVQIAGIACGPGRNRNLLLLSLGLLVPMGQGIGGIIQHYSTLSTFT